MSLSDSFPDEYKNQFVEQDCSSIQKRDVPWLLGIIAENPRSVIGEISEADLKEIKVRIKSARTITPAIKKTFGLYL